MLEHVPRTGRTRPQVRHGIYAVVRVDTAWYENVLWVYFTVILIVKTKKPKVASQLHLQMLLTRKCFSNFL